jgi:hypothetical protein
MFSKEAFLPNSVTRSRCPISVARAYRSNPPVTEAGAFAHLGEVLIFRLSRPARRRLPEAE